MTATASGEHRPPLVCFEDDHLLVVNKPAGLNTHAPSPYAGEGIYDWLRHRERRWATLAIIHRLDKETSGLLIFTKTTSANRALTAQFAAHTVRKKYALVTDRLVARKEIKAVSVLVRAGEKYVSHSHQTGGASAETHFCVRHHQHGGTTLEAQPVTGRTHQIRVHAAEHGFPILGDTLYGGTPAARVFLHAEELTLTHPVTDKEITFCVPADFAGDQRLALRQALIAPSATNAFRLLHGAADGWPGWYVDRLGDFLLSQSERPLTDEQRKFLENLERPAKATRHLQQAFGIPCLGCYHKLLTRQVRLPATAENSPRPALGQPAPERFTILENGARFELSFQQGSSLGLFLDQRDNRRRLLTGHIAAGFDFLPGCAAQPEVLNTFAYTCGYSVCAALAGACTTSLDLSRNYLDWGKRNFALNQLDPAAHDFLCGDTFDWLRRFVKKRRAFDVILLDPPTFSRSKQQGAFRAEKDYGELVAAALPLLKPDGILFASTNAARLEAEDFVQTVESAIRGAHRHVTQRHYVPQPPDFPITRAEPAFLKTVWLRVQ